MNDKNDNAADVDQINKKTMNAKELRKQWVKDLKEVVSTPAGKRVLWGIMAYGGLLSRAMTGNSETFFRLGKQDVALYIYEELQQAAPQELAAVIIENANT